MADESLTRIYQGRVNQIFSKEHDISFDEGQNIVWSHHVLFQDAVNYYLLALAGMADTRQTKTPETKFRLAMERTWDDFWRNGKLREGMKHSIARTLQCNAENLSIQDAIDKILGKNHVDCEILHEAIKNISDGIKGDIVQAAGKYLPQLCSPEFKGNFDFASDLNNGRIGIRKILDLLDTKTPKEAQEKLNQIKGEMQLTWVGQKTQSECYSLPELKKVLTENIDFLITKSALPPDVIDTEKLAELKKHIQEIKRTNIQKTGTGPKNNILFAAALLLICFGDISLLNIIESQRKTIEKKKKEWGEAGTLSDDPIKLARGNRGYVFNFFTKLPSWSSPWKDFDIETFIEALKILNLFKQKINERQAKLDKITNCLNWMETGMSSNGKPPKLADLEEENEEAESDEPSKYLPILKDDPRWLQLQKILHENLAISNELTEDEIIDYGLSERTIRGAKSIFKEWNDILRQDCSQAVEEKLRKVLVAYQTQNSQIIGSAPLFLELTKKENHCIWDSNYQSKHKYASKNILEDAVIYYDLREEANFLDEPIKFTPADSRYSRRLSNLKTLSGQKQDKTKGGMVWGNNCGLHDKNQLDVLLAAMQKNGKWAKEKFTFSFSAPRLLRDQLIRGENPIYCPPIAQAFNAPGTNEPSLEDEAKIVGELQDAAIQLMPDYDRKGKLRLLLNFQPSLDISNVKDICLDVFPDKFFYGGKDEKFSLEWPDYNHKKPLWCDSSSPFDIVSVDLGQRTAGAISRIRISTERQNNSIYIGNDGHKNWYATQIYGGLLRLPGEDAQTNHGKDELSGSAGRLATQSETEEAKSIAAEILNSGKEMQEFLVDDITTDGELIYKKYFPSQNDTLLRVFKRGLYRLRQLSRWHFFWKNGEKEKVLAEAKEANWLHEKSLEEIKAAELKLREILKNNLLRMTERILPLRGRHWELVTSPTGSSLILQQTIPSPEDTKRWICGQRGLSFARLEQLENLRHCFQSINRILMEEPGAKRKSIRDLRGLSIPDCCPDILMRLDELKAQRVNQTANMILAQALGLRHKEIHTQTKEYRTANNIHGEYEQIPGLSPAKFIVIENLSRYRFSQDRPKFENSRLMKWSHRAIRDKLKMLCEVYGLTVVEVNASYSSKFSSQGTPGFRAEELSWKEVRKKSFFYRSLKENVALENDIKKKIDLLILQAQKENKTILLPKQGGPIFIPFAPENNDAHLVQADINASFNLGLRALAHQKVLDIHHKLSIKKTKKGWTLNTTSKLQKKIFSNDGIFTMEEKDFPVGEFSNIFVCGCACHDFARNSAYTDDTNFKEFKGKIMIGFSIWKDKIFQFNRCLEINRKRLN